MPLTGFRCCLQDFWIKAARLFGNSRWRSAEQTWSEQVHLGVNKEVQPKQVPKGNKERPDNSSFQKMAPKHQDQENPRN